tara:strand:+ start:905 stop:1999 length:1095 start_codon:yes stop_codon:yes gene_type:complete
VPLIKVPPLALIIERLPLIFPEGTEHRNYLIREMAAKTIFVMFYAGAVDSIDRWVRPSQITDMSDEQSLLLGDDDRDSWVKLMLSNKKKKPVNPWYASNSREPIRDETIRTGLIPLQAVTVRSGIPTTSSKPTYALQTDFAQLFDIALIDNHLSSAIGSWQENYLSKVAITRLKLMKHNLSNDSGSVQITFPDGAIRTLEAGPSSLISKAVIEEFAPRFLKQPHVLWLSESGNKVVAQDEALAKALGLKIDASRALPDIILVDLGDEKTGAEMLVIFTEVVASDGPINRQRKKVLTTLAEDAGFDQKNLAFLTAFTDRSAAPFKKCVTDLAWGSYAWFSTEPDHIVDLREQSKTVKLSTLRFLS